MKENKIVDRMKNHKSFIKNLFMEFYEHNFFIQFIHGALLTLAFHPFDIFLVIPISFSGFLWCLEKELITSVERDTGNFFKSGFKHGFIFFLGHFVSSLYWIVNPLLFEIKRYWFLIPFAILLIPIFLSLFYAFFSGIICSHYMLKNIHKISTQKRIQISLLFAFGFFLAEILRANLIIIFPWNLLGYATSYSLSLMQLASITGVYGLSLLLYVVGTIPYSKNSIAISFTTVLVVFITMFGNKRINDAVVLSKKKFVNLHVIQPNTKHHYHQYNQQLAALEKTKNILRQHIHSKTSQAINNTANIHLIIFPETGIPFVIDKHQNILFDDFMSKYNSKSFLVSGIDRYDGSLHEHYNSMILVNNEDEIIDSYDKILLTPFGEYIPGYKVLKFIIQPLVGNHFGFTAGTKTRNMKIYVDSNIYHVQDNLSIMPMICSESIFTPFNYLRESSGVDMIVNITNDSWLGESIGPYQHLAMSRMRAIEYGLPLVRAAKTGISAVFNSYGQLIQKIHLNVEGVIVTEMPEEKIETTYIKIMKILKNHD